MEDIAPTTCMAKQGRQPVTQPHDTPLVQLRMCVYNVSRRAQMILTSSGQDSDTILLKILYCTTESDRSHDSPRIENTVKYLLVTQTNQVIRLIRLSR